jgi:hypothetical protein
MNKTTTMYLLNGMLFAVGCGGQISVERSIAKVGGTVTYDASEIAIDTISFDDISITSETVSKTKNVEMLRQLIFNNCTSGSSGDMSQLIRNLQPHSISIQGRTPNNTIEWIKAGRRVSAVQFDNVAVMSRDLDCLGKLSSLSSLACSSCDFPDGYGGLSLLKVERLSITDDANCTERVLGSVRHIATLRHLNISDTSVADISSLAESDINTIVLDGLTLTQSSCNVLSKMKSLQGLSMERCDIVADCELKITMPRELLFVSLADASYSRSFFFNLVQQSRIECLDVSGTEFGRIELEELNTAAISILNIQDTSIKSEDLDILSNLKPGTYLHVRHGQFNDSDIKTFKDNQIRIKVDEEVRF